MLCGKCGASLQDGAAFCDKCGMKVDQSNADMSQVQAGRYCLSCGKRLPEGAAFCDACGTSIGTINAAARQRYAPPRKPSMFGKLVRNFFKAPATTIETAKSEDAFLSGIGFFLIKAGIIAIIAALIIGGLSNTAMEPFYSSSLPFAAENSLTILVMVFLAAVILDAVWVLLLFAWSKAFRGQGSLKSMIGASGAASIMITASIIVSAILAVIPAAVVCISLLTITVTIIAMTKAVSVVSGLVADKVFYIMTIAAVSFGIVIFIITSIFTAGTTGGYEYSNYL